MSVKDVIRLVKFKNLVNLILIDKLLKIMFKFYLKPDFLSYYLEKLLIFLRSLVKV